MAARIQDIEQRLWQAADELRANSRLSSQEYSLPVLGLIFLKYADVRFGRAQVQRIRAQEPAADIVEVMNGVESLLDRSVEAEAFRIHEPGAPFDLASIDFEALRAKFEAGHRNIAANRLRGQLNAKLQRMVRLNATRMDYVEKLRQMIEDYNAGRDNVELFFEKLLALAAELSEEEQRGMRENLSEEELALFDILLKPRPEMTAGDEARVKEAARELLDTLKAERLVLDWHKQQRTRAEVLVTIKRVLDARLPEAYDTGWYEEKVGAVYTHVYERYRGDGVRKN